MSYSKTAPRPQSSSAKKYNDDISPSDIEKVQTLWNEIQQNKRQLEDVQSFHHRESSSSLSHYITENQELREKLRLSERQLNDARDKIVFLTRKIDETDDAVRSYQDQTNKQESLNSMKTYQLNKMTTQYESLNLTQKEIIERSREANLALIHDLDEKNKEIEKYKSVSKNRGDQLSMVSVSHSQASAKIYNLEDELETQRRENAFLKKDLEDARRTINDLQQVKKSEGMAMIEIEHLRGDVQRLVKMLKTTKEYSDFSDFADDHSGSIRFFKDTLRQTQVDVNFKRTAGANTSSNDVFDRLCAKEALLEEKEVWMPRDAFKFAQEFRRKYNGELTDALLEKLLFELNRIWSRKEQQRVQRIQSQYAHEIMKLKRKLTQSPPFSEVQAKQTIHRLKNDLKTSYLENRKAFDERTEKNPPGTHYINETMKIVKNSLKMKKTMSQENDFLREQLRTSSAGKSVSGF